MINEAIHNKAIHFVLSTYLSEWNSDLTLDQVLEALENEDYDNAVPWEPFENMDPEDLTRNISNSIDHFVSLFNEEI